MLGTGDGAFEPGEPIPGIIGSECVALGDVNSDGHLDVIATERLAARIAVRLGNGDGTFTEVSPLPTLGAPHYVATADLNGDGNLDIVDVSEITQFNTPSVGVHLGLGDGEFEAMQPYIAGHTPETVAITDFNRDGVPDLVVANHQQDALSILIGVGDGTFEPQQLFALPAAARSVTAGDFDGNGDADIAAAGAEGVLKVLCGYGTGDFATFDTLPMPSIMSNVTAGDIDTDGDLDLVAANGLGSNISLVLNNGDGTFAPLIEIAIGEPTTSVAIGDLNGDEAPDIVVGHSNSGVSVLINQTQVFAPDAFELLSPPDGATGLATPELLAAWPSGPEAAALKWDASGGFNVEYTVTIALDEVLTNVVYEESGVTASQLAIPTGAIDSGGAYYWSVTADNAIGATSATNGPFMFKTSAPADLTGDGSVNGADLALLLANWGIIE